MILMFNKKGLLLSVPRSEKRLLATISSTRACSKYAGWIPADAPRTVSAIGMGCSDAPFDFISGFMTSFDDVIALNISTAPMMTAKTSGRGALE